MSPSESVSSSTAYSSTASTKAEKGIAFVFTGSIVEIPACNLAKETLDTTEKNDQNRNETYRP
jgi:hypothetical protein